uniref:Manganese/iron superoxide dismutase C-terminal domain-containing protein n=1 Tax=Trypanosoma vivax (strain Y486) TaxID=1055687 RepID=G0TUP2_TRYVY|nr:conserved hypothetical protein, fragment [Trypanosoma vivax Y486]
MLQKSFIVRCRAAEVQKLVEALFPLLDPPIPIGTVLSGAQVIIATSYTSRYGDGHKQDCPVLARRLPLTAIASDAAFMKRPCVQCLKRRVNFIASEDFSRKFEEECMRSSSAVPSEWRNVVTQQFGAMEVLETELVKRAISRREPGWTWLVYDGRRCVDQRLVGMNLPANQTPLTHGLWPLAAVNMTEGALVSAMQSKLKETGVVPHTHPHWSRAGRNPAAAVTTRGLGTTSIVGLDGNANLTLSSIRESVARDAVAKMNWAFVLEQWKRAEAYYSCEDRSEKIQIQRAKMEREAALEAMSRLKSSGATILTSDTVEITTTTAGKPQCSRLADGTWQYLYSNGDVTLLQPDGTRVFRKSNLTTTVYTDGSTLYEYPNNSSILDRADGVRVTRFADGTTKEEKLR